MTLLLAAPRRYPVPTACEALSYRDQGHIITFTPLRCKVATVIRGTGMGQGNEMRGQLTLLRPQSCLAAEFRFKLSLSDSGAWVHHCSDCKGSVPVESCLQGLDGCGFSLCPQRLHYPSVAQETLLRARVDPWALPLCPSPRAAFQAAQRVSLLVNAMH